MNRTNVECRAAEDFSINGFRCGSNDLGATESGFSVLLHDPILNDVRKLIQVRRTWYGATILTAVFRIAQLFPIHTLNSYAQRWFLEVCTATDAPFLFGRVCWAVRKVRNRKHWNAKPATMAKWCGVTAHLAHSVNLQALRPAPPRPRSAGLDTNERRKATRWATGVLPSLVDIGSASAWILERVGRSKWFKKYGSIERQYRALAALIVMNATEQLRAVKQAVDEAARIRVAGCPAHRLPIDDLLDELRRTLSAYEAEATNAPVADSTVHPSSTPVDMPAKVPANSLVQRLKSVVSVWMTGLHSAVRRIQIEGPQNLIGPQKHEQSRATHLK
jgi:hypothetical protein